MSFTYWAWIGGVEEHINIILCGTFLWRPTDCAGESPPITFLEERVTGAQYFWSWLGKEQWSNHLSYRDSLDLLIFQSYALPPHSPVPIDAQDQSFFNWISPENEPSTPRLLLAILGEEDLLSNFFLITCLTKYQNAFWNSWYQNFCVSTAQTDFFSLVTLSSSIQVSTFSMAPFSTCFPTMDLSKPLQSLVLFIYVF